MRFKRTLILPAILLLTLGMAVGVEMDSIIDGRKVDFRSKLEQAFAVITGQYVDEVDTENLVTDAIEGMLAQLDPHSTYISAAEIQEVQEEYQGSFGGIGIWFEILNDTARVVSTIPDGPSEKVGLRAGDRIVGVGDTTAVGWTNNLVQKYLKGPIGTHVSLTVKRPGALQPIRFQITRSRIPLYTVDSAYMIDDRTGYIKISRFAMTTYDEFMEKLGTLKKQGMQRLVLDLRGNPGGVMDAAVNIADEFLASGQSIVYTRSRHKELEAMHRSTAGGLFETNPVMVLVSPYSASASEIVAGALQDHDRALIVGQRTFGKGLVQQQFRLQDGSVLQMTVSRYYTPAGRLIQTPYKDGDQAAYYENKIGDWEQATYHPADYIHSIPDSLKYKTDHGRVVFGGGGILPDYVVAFDTTSLYTAVAISGVDELAARTWFTKNEQRLRAAWTGKQEAFKRDFKLDAGLWKSFVDSLSSNGFKLVDKPSGERTRGEQEFTNAELRESRARLEVRLKAYIARQLYGFESSIQTFNEVDPVFTEALKLWDRASDLAKWHTRK